VAVPTHYFKIVVAVDARGRPAEAVAFVVPNVKQWDGSKPQDHLVSVRWIEDRTGLDFMPDETSARQEQLETAVNPMWN
jgi:DNA/RNA endonuclease G (NUC1)